jgi:hypothetical protein
VQSNPGVLMFLPEPICDFNTRCGLFQAESYGYRYYWMANKLAQPAVGESLAGFLRRLGFWHSKEIRSSVLSIT